ncbi:MAG: type VI secretion system baseplate subunit TssG [Methylobacteriaceae bacterium]|nr:type VI secretion system baseplate subunit TssG [Methylobacteriaceae bacterium]
MVLRRLERSHPDRPRIGDAATRRDDFVTLGQDPYFEFPASTVSDFRKDPTGRWRVLQKFLGLLGPQGALPLATTEEAYGWLLARDDAFARFCDLINHRFLELFFRAWADARPVAQHDRPKDDRFRDYVASTIGLGTPIYRDLDSVPDSGKIAYAGLVGAKAKGAARLRRLIRGLLGVECEIDEFVGAWLTLEPQDRSHLGAQSRLGVDMMAGGSFYSIEDKIRIRLFMSDMAEYERFLPGAYRCEELTDLVFFYLGDEIEWEVELAIPAEKAPAVRLGKAGRLGWTSWSAPSWSGDRRWLCDARFHPAERRRQTRSAARAQPTVTP